LDPTFWGGALCRPGRYLTCGADEADDFIEDRVALSSVRSRRDARHGWIGNARAEVHGQHVNGGQWLPAARQYVERHVAELRRVPVAVFSVHIMNVADTVRARRKRLAYLDPIRPSLQPVGEAFFLGKGPDPARDSWLSRWPFRRFGGVGEGDCRAWDKIRVLVTSVLANQLQPV
jgi:hypothetical protein